MRSLFYFGWPNNFHLRLGRFLKSTRVVVVTTGFCQIAAGQSDVVVVGGVDFMSDVPIRLSRPVRKSLMKLNRVKGLL